MTVIDLTPSEQARLVRSLRSANPATRYAALRRAMQRVDTRLVTFAPGSANRVEATRTYERLARQAREAHAECEARQRGEHLDASSVALARITHLLHA